MNYTVTSIVHFPGETALKQGISKDKLGKFTKNNHVIGGGNGSFVTLNGVSTNLNCLDENGKTVSFDINKKLKSVTNGKRFTTNFIDIVNSKYVGKSFEIKNEENLHEVIYNFLKENY